jgi:hypothetical protein
MARFLIFKVGAPPQVASLLEEVSRERSPGAAGAGEIGVDPELDEFMVCSWVSVVYNLSMLSV